MAKVVVEIKDNKKNKEKCTVGITIQGIEKATDTEKGTTAMIYNKICETLKGLN